MDYVHHIPGRLRVRSARIRGSEAGARAAERKMGSLGGVRSVSANPLTGSITVLYDPALIGAETLLANLREQGYAAHTRLPDRAVPAKLPSVKHEVAAAIAKRAATYAVEAALERSIAALVTAIL